MKKIKYIYLPILLLIGIIVLFFMYRKQHHLYKDTLQLNRQLVSQVNHLQDKNVDLQDRLKHIQQTQATKKLLHPTFMTQQKYNRQHWKEDIRCSLNDYTVGLFGGIKNLKITVANKTGYALNNATMLLSYYRANGDLYKTETVTIQNIPAEGHRTVSAPKSRRGTNVKAAFSQIKSKEMNFCWDKDKKVSPENPDPYRCNVE